MAKKSPDQTLILVTAVIAILFIVIGSGIYVYKITTIFQHNQQKDLFLPAAQSNLPNQTQTDTAPDY